MKSPKKAPKILNLDPETIEKFRDIVDEYDAAQEDSTPAAEDPEVVDPDLDELRFSLPQAGDRPFSGKKGIPDALHDDDDEGEDQEIRSTPADDMEGFDSERLEFGHPEDEGW